MGAGACKLCRAFCCSYHVSHFFCASFTFIWRMLMLFNSDYYFVTDYIGVGDLLEDLCYC